MIFIMCCYHYLNGYNMIISRSARFRFNDRYLHQYEVQLNTVFTPRTAWISSFPDCNFFSRYILVVCGLKYKQNILFISPKSFSLMIETVLLESWGQAAVRIVSFIIPLKMTVLIFDEHLALIQITALHNRRKIQQSKPYYTYRVMKRVRTRQIAIHFTVYYRYILTVLQYIVQYSTDCRDQVRFSVR